MAKREPSDRAKAFKSWMAAEGLNTKRVAINSGVPYTTLASFVQGDTKSLKGENEELIAAAFKVSASEIFARATSPFAPIVGYVGANPEGEVLFSTGDSPQEFAPIPPGGSEDSAALWVRGHSMRGVADDGALIYFEDQRTPPTPDMLRSVVIVETEGGEVLIKRLLKGSGPDLYDLESLVGPLREDVRLHWAARITAIIPPHQARQVVRQASDREPISQRGAG